MRQLITNDEAVPASEQHKKACSDCPWARASLAGWLGALSADQWLMEAHGEANIDCHVLTGVQCAGAAIYRANIAKLPRDPELLRLQPDREKVFASPSEFLAHHKGGPVPTLTPTSASLYCCDVCAVEIPEDEDQGPCPGCGESFCFDHYDPENHGPIDPVTRRQGCESWDFSVEHYGPKSEDD